MTVGALAAIELRFDPLVRVGPLTVPWATIVLALALLAALLAFAVGARHVAAGRPADIVYVCAAAVPGAVVGGRLVHGLVFAQAYAVDPGSLLDLSRGSLSLGGAVIGGALSASYIAAILGGSVRSWADAAAVPLLMAVGLGKLFQSLAGGGQGAAFDGPWAVAFGGPGPWRAVDPAIPAHPSQVYEAAVALSGIAVVALLVRRGLATPGSGNVFLAAVGWWLAGRALVAFTWRDDRVLGPLNAEQAWTVGVLLAGGVWLAMGRRGRRTADTEAARV